MISTVSCPRSVWRRSNERRVFWREISPSSTGTASAPSLVWIKRQTKASAATSAHLWPCAAEFATCAPAGVKVISSAQAVEGERNQQQKLSQLEVKAVACRPFLLSDPSELPQTVAPITEERASRTLYRISLLRRLREQVLPHPSLDERLPLAPTSSELPSWWSIPDHDRQLMLGASMHGVSRTELSIFSDPQFTFSQSREEFIQNQQAPPPPPPPPPPQAPPIVPLSLMNSEEGISGVKEEGPEVDPHLLSGEMAVNLQSTPLSLHDGKVGGQGWSVKKSRGKVGKSARKTEGGSDSDSDSDSGSSSSDRSGSSDDSGESDEEGEGGGLIFFFCCCLNGKYNAACRKYKLTPFHFFSSPKDE